MTTKISAADREPPNQSGRTAVAQRLDHHQPAPKVLQAKAEGRPRLQAGQSQRLPVAPPAYRPESKKIIQPKIPLVAQTTRSQKAPPAYRPQPTPRVLQRKESVTTKTAGRSKPTISYGKQRQGQPSNNVVQRAEVTEIVDVFEDFRGDLAATFSKGQDNIDPGTTPVYRGFKKGRKFLEIGKKDLEEYNVTLNKKNQIPANTNTEKSLCASASKLREEGLDPQRVYSVPDGLKIKQTGPLNHAQFVTTADMTLSQLNKLLDQVVFV